MKPAHLRISQMLGYTLTMAEAEAWGGFSTVCRARLSICERAGMAIASLCSLPDDYALDTAAAALGSSGSPLPPFLRGMKDARSWAGYATRQELKAYALACFEAMTPQDQAAFFRRISDIEVTA